jgi:hypothetical protein
MVEIKPQLSPSSDEQVNTLLTNVGNDMLKMYKMGEQFLNANSHERLRIITAILDGLEIDINAVREYLQKFKKDAEQMPSAIPSL